MHALDGTKREHQRSSSKATLSKGVSMSRQVLENPKEHPTGNAAKNPDDWVTGDEPMTGAQASYLQTLSEEAGDKLDPALSKADASKKIDELREKTGRGNWPQIGASN
jgi:hypothetical protein